MYSSTRARTSLSAEESKSTRSPGVYSVENVFVGATYTTAAFARVTRRATLTMVRSSDRPTGPAPRVCTSDIRLVALEPAGVTSLFERVVRHLLIDEVAKAHRLLADRFRGHQLIDLRLQSVGGSPQLCELPLFFGLLFRFLASGHGIPSLPRPRRSAPAAIPHSHERHRPAASRQS
jgi:hypothetical protein